MSDKQDKNFKSAVEALRSLKLSPMRVKGGMRGFAKSARIKNHGSIRSLANLVQYRRAQFRTGVGNRASNKVIYSEAIKESAFLGETKSYRNASATETWVYNNLRVYQEDDIAWLEAALEGGFPEVDVDEIELHSRRMIWQSALNVSFLGIRACFDLRRLEDIKCDDPRWRNLHQNLESHKKMLLSGQRLLSGVNKLRAELTKQVDEPLEASSLGEPSDGEPSDGESSQKSQASQSDPKLAHFLTALRGIQD